MKNKKNELNYILEQELNVQFALACLDNDTETVKEYIKNNYINDFKYEQGMFAIYAATKGNLEILKMIYEECPEIKEYQHDILKSAANSGNKECVNFIVNQGATYTDLKGTVAYNNYPAIKDFFDNYIHLPIEEKHVDVEDIGSDSKLMVNDFELIQN